MLHRRGTFLDVNVGSQINVCRTKLAEEAMHLALDPGRRGAINFDAIAGREQHDFVQPGIQLEPAAVAGQKRRAPGQPLAHFHGRGLVSQTCDKYGHAKFSTVNTYPRDVPVTGTQPSPMLPARRLAFWNRHTCFTKQIYRDGKKLLLIHWQPLYISCHWNSILILAGINK